MATAWAAGALALALAAAPVLAGTRAGVVIGPPVIQLVDLDLGDGIESAFTPGGPRLDLFDALLGPAPVHVELSGDARITADEDDAIGGRTDGPGSSFLIVGDRYAPSFTFLASGHTRVTVQATYTLAAAIDGEPFDPADPARALASFELAVAAANNLRVDAAGERVYDFLAFTAQDAVLASPLDRPWSGELTQSGLLSVSFENLSAEPAVFAFRGEMVAWGIGAPRQCPAR